MDTKQLIKDSKARFKHNSAKQYLKDKYQSKLTVASQGGLWQITPELLAIINSCVSKECILLDSFGTPVKVETLKLLNVLRTTYNTVMEEWYNEYKELENNR